MRCSPLNQADVTALVDEYKSSLSEILNIDFSDNRNWSQASLPLLFGGLGIRGVSTIAPSYFIASCSATSELQKLILNKCTSMAPDLQLSVAIIKWETLSRNSDKPSENEVAFQKHWDNPICKTIFSDLLVTASEEDKARLHSVSSPKAGCWLSSIPSANLGLRLSSKQLNIACALRLGAKVCENHLCKQCQQVIETSGSHLMACKKSY